jgi:hypothetical protein
MSAPGFTKALFATPPPILPRIVTAFPVSLLPALSSAPQEAIYLTSILRYV